MKDNLIGENLKKCLQEEKSNINDSDFELNKVRILCKEVSELARSYDVDFFFVTEGASVCSISHNEAVRHARNCHEEWERDNGYDPNEDWNHDF